jgi:hypothetical protein
LKTVLPLLSVFSIAIVSLAPARAAPTEWLQDTVLADCRYCQTDAFAAERRRIANQVGPEHDPASGMGYVVTIEGDGRFVWGRAALLGTGNLIRTDAHVLFAETGRLKIPDGKVYFEPMQHGGASNLIEIERFSIQRGGPVGDLDIDVKNDWAIARLKEDAIEKFGGDRVFAFLWDLRITHDEIVKHHDSRAAALVLSREHTLDIDRSCQRVTDDHPSRYAFGVEEVFFLRCPSEYLQVGSSGSTLAISTPDGTWNLGAQVVAGETRDPMSEAPSGGSGPAGAWAQQLFLGNVPMFRQVMAIVYLKELIRRGMDPRDR